MHTSAAAAPSAHPRAEEAGALAGMGGATVGALGAVDLMIGVAMLVASGAVDSSPDGVAAATAMRAYGVRAVIAGGLNLGFVWALFSEPGARAAWLLVPLGIAALDIVADFAARAAGGISPQALTGTIALHFIFAAGVAAVAASAWQRERAAAAAASSGA